MTSLQELQIKSHPGPGPVQLKRIEDDKKVPYTLFSIRPLSPTIGVEISGIDLREELNEQLHKELHRALLEWKVLFFRNQPITPQQHLSFAKKWGALEIHPFLPTADQNEIIQFKKDHTITGYENTWHTDVTWRDVPSLGSILRCVETPEVGGDTLFCDMYAAFENLPSRVREEISKLSAVHSAFPPFPDTPENRANFPEQIHPVVRTHPETGRNGIFVNKSFTKRIVGVPESESRRLLDALFLQATVPEYQCRWRWEKDSIAFWDNRCTQHYASSDYFPSRRIVQRVTIAGTERPFLTASPKL
jgi:taurine dioxygenase